MPKTLDKIPDFMNEVLTGSSDPAMGALLSRRRLEAANAFRDDEDILRF